MTNEYYIAEFEKIEARMNGVNESDRLRAMAREEATKIVNAYAVGIGGTAAILYVGNRYGATWFWLACGVAVLWFVWDARQRDLSPDKDRHLVGLIAQDVARLDHLREADERGVDVWSADPSARGEIMAQDGTHWEGWWQRVWMNARDLEHMSARDRRKRDQRAAVEALPMLEKGHRLAGEHNSNLIYWAKSALEKGRKAQPARRWGRRVV